MNEFVFIPIQFSPNTTLSPIFIFLKLLFANENLLIFFKFGIFKYPVKFESLNAYFPTCSNFGQSKSPSNLANLNPFYFTIFNSGQLKTPIKLLC